MIYLFNNNEQLIKIINDPAIRSLNQHLKLTDEGYVSNQLFAEIKAQNDIDMNEVEYFAIKQAGEKYKYDYYFALRNTTEHDITELTGVDAGVEELKKTPIYDIRPNGDARQHAETILQGTNWTVGYMPSTGLVGVDYYYMSAFDALKKMIQAFGVEMQLHVEINGNRIGNRYIEFKERLGVKSGKRVTYGHNALKIIKETQKDNLYTALIGRGKGVQVSSAEENPGGSAGYSRKITFEDVVWSTDNGDPVNKPAGQQYVEIPQATAQYGIKTPQGARPKIGFIEFDSEEPEDVLRRTYNELIYICRPQVMFETSTAYLSADIADTVRVIRDDLNIDYEVRVIEVAKDRLVNRTTSIVLGDRLIESANSQRQSLIDSVNSEFEQVLDERLGWLPSANGFNKNWYTDVEPPNPRIDDVWWAPDLEHEGHYIMYQWDGENWLELVRSYEMTPVADAIAYLKENELKTLQEEIDAAEIATQRALQRADESIAGLGTLTTTVSDLRGDLDTVSNTAKSSLEIIGIDGGAYYSKNRRLGAKSQAIQPDERGFIRHNGEGFGIGETYTISLKATCIFDDVITWEERTRTEVVPFVRETAYDATLLPEQSKVTRQGVDGSATYTWQVELVNGELTGNKTEEIRAAYKAPVNELFVQGTKQVGQLTLNFTADTLTPTPAPKTKANVILNLIEPGGSIPADPDPIEPVEPGESNFDNARVVNLADYGGVGDASTDNFNALKSAIADSVNEPLVLEVNAGDYYVQGGLNQRLEVWPNESKGLRLVGKGNVTFYHKNNRDNQKHEYYFMQLIMAEDSLGFEVENITLDGRRNPQEELFYTQSDTNPISNIPMARGISVHGAHNVNFNNVTFKNMYGGYGIVTEEYRNVNITNTTFDKVGGNDIQESFGMTIYLGGHTGSAVVNIDNVHAQGMVTNKDLRLSWIGVVLENGTIQSNDPSMWMRDKNTTVNITNSSFMDYQSTFHVESVAGNVYWNVDNLETRASNYQIVAGVYGEYKESSNNVRMDMVPYGRLWGIVKGLYYSEAQEQEDNWNGHNMMNMYNSVINLQKVTGFDDPPQAVAYGNNVTGRLHNTQINNLPHKLVTNGSALVYNSEINLAQGSSETRQTLQNGNFSDASKQRVELNNTNVNPYGSHKTVAFGNKPVFVKNQGFVAPFIELPISAPI